MLRDLNIVTQIRCSEDACKDEDGEMCEHFRLTFLNASPFCNLFYGTELVQKDSDGDHFRCKACLSAEVKKEG